MYIEAYMTSSEQSPKYQPDIEPQYTHHSEEKQNVADLSEIFSKGVVSDEVRQLIEWMASFVPYDALLDIAEADTEAEALDLAESFFVLHQLVNPFVVMPGDHEGT